MNAKVDAFLKNAEKWREEMEALRSLALDCGLSEELKWGKPCNLFNNGNIAIIQPFKDRCAFMFFKGALLNDASGLLEAPGPNSHAARRMMFSTVEEVVRMGPHLRALIAEAIEVENAGLKVPARKDPAPIPDELAEMYEKVSGLEEAFGALTPGRQRAYLLHFTSAKQAETRTSRIEKCVPRILEGKGLNNQWHGQDQEATHYHSQPLYRRRTSGCSRPRSARTIQQNSMQPKISMITLGVSDLERSARFYEEGLGLPRMPLEADVAFFTLNGTWLALYSREALAQDAQVPSEGSGFSGFSLAHNVDSRDEVDRIIQQAAAAGATVVKSAVDAEWGGYSGYFADLDGHLWEVAWNPHLRIGPQDVPETS